MSNFIKLIVGALLGVSLGGCLGVDPSRPEPIYKPAYPRAAPVEPASAGAIYQTSGGLSLFRDSRASQIGDLLTIQLEERTSSSKSAETSIKKESENKLPNPSVFGNLVRGTSPDYTDIENSAEFSGEAESDQSNSLSGTLSAVVAEVLPNGLLLVQGEKWLNLNRGEEYIRVSGLVRPADIGADNSVSSLRLADARIAYSGTGELANSNRSGWLSRFFLNPILPF